MSPMKAPSAGREEGWGPKAGGQGQRSEAGQQAVIAVEDGKAEQEPEELPNVATEDLQEPDSGGL